MKSLSPGALPCSSSSCWVCFHKPCAPFICRAVPTIATAWQGVAEAESRRAGDAALAAYTETFKEDVS